MKNIEPQQVFSIFHDITQVPRPSKHEEQIIAWLVDFAQKHNLEYELDEIKNVIIRKPASVGYESHSGVILQAHMDMVCEKNGDVQHDFLKDPIDYYIDGDWIRTRGTTLGGDNGIGMALALAILTDNNLQHPAIEALFTVDEETGLTGADCLQKGILKGTKLINLDSEDDGQIFVGCSGGIDTLGKIEYTPIQTTTIPQQLFAVEIKVSNLQGGHSGSDIDKNRANANKLLAHFLFNVSQKTDIWINAFNGGNLRNAIAREANVTFCVSADYKDSLAADFNIYTAEVEKVYAGVEKDIKWSIGSVEMPAVVMPKEVGNKLIYALCTCPHGVQKMSAELENLVQTSTNLASTKTYEKDGKNCIEITTSQRSSVEIEKHLIKDEVACTLLLAGAEVTYSDGYPGWQPNMQSELLKLTKDAYLELFQEEPTVLAIHAGLECGLFLAKYPNLDMVSIGPQMYDVHSPSERLSISSTKKCYYWLIKILSKC